MQCRPTRRPQRFPEAGCATGYNPVRKAREKPGGNEHSRLGEKAIFVTDVLRQRPTEPRGQPAVGGVKHPGPDRQGFRNQYADRGGNARIKRPYRKQEWAQRTSVPKGGKIIPLGLRNRSEPREERVPARAYE